ncbi:MAG: hypothetical protein Q4G28_00905 [Neisseria sp.]|nr:hypothetical protein [Neisseria sp.]
MKKQPFDFINEYFRIVPNKQSFALHWAPAWAGATGIIVSDGLLSPGNTFACKAQQRRMQG